ncbi:voltage-dependent calcium channel subunit alpha-2/delta-4 [Thrips palmi]|uniref:Voltage-dependent calcium channel subunit alpha-2/delta-4 n=1 Tax=Thrips palmi TaxID=161013 RepID=A0A6P8ZMA6_THRPL|nr:voltage-dependent calcium channel subunit alpha-2/delta-4 [Thrips palmi]
MTGPTRAGLSAGPGRPPRGAWMLFLLLLTSAVPESLEQDEDIPHNEVRNWALKLGVTLWAYGKETTKMNEIQRKYREKDVKVARKDGLMLVRDMTVELKNMMDAKMHAVLRIMDSAEQAALSHKMEHKNGKATVWSPEAGAQGRRDGMRSSRHFDHLPVNTNRSNTMLAEDVTERDPTVTNGIVWSELLDALFINNYETDPTLSWQYFGSASGFLRRYPASRVPADEFFGDARAEIHDFRTSQWYVSAATSPKDVVILLDSSSSVSSTKRALALLTARTILETLGDNDFVNVFRFADTAAEIVPCFKDMLVQATTANLRELKAGLGGVRPEGSANTTAALVTAFDLLHRYNRTGQGSQCNQAIMLITAGPVLASYSNVLKHYNWPHMPVRMFTYLIGKDSSTASELNKIACGNKGYFNRMSNRKDVRAQVLKYVSVMSRPLVMYQNEHPVQWTPVYRGGKGNSLLRDEVKYGQLMTSVSAPVFDRRNATERVANLLGVVGTDIPIEQIMKLVPPYKLGVNGYGFLVDNNGHVLFHPDLRPMQNSQQFQDTLKPEYNSVDLTEVELVDSDGGPRENNSMLLDLRHDMIDQKEGETDLTIKTDFNGMRVATRRNKYFYNPIYGTPFSLALALPEGYGMYEAIGEEEIKRSPVNLTECFKGDNWRVHPDWVYCEYNYASDHHFKSPEDQFLHFLNKVRKPGWKWMSQRHWTPQAVKDMKKLDRDSYYCDKTLVQSLVYDAVVTQTLDQPPRLDRPSNANEDRHPIAVLMALWRSEGYQFFGATMSFVATRSGLLRWQKLGDGHHSEKNPVFSEAHRRSIDETWYKRAVDQHRVEPESFVYSVPFDAGQRGGKPLVTATHAVFVEHKGHRAPAAVVGVQYLQSILSAHFLNITSTCTSKCSKTCKSDELDCYVLDNNGFIILSEVAEQAGAFFGQVDGTIMDSLVQDRIFKRVAVYDYQGACSDQDSPYSAAPGSPRAPTVASLFRSLTEGVLAYVAAAALDLQIGALLSDTWAATARMLRDYPSFADDYDSDADVDDAQDEDDVGEEEDEEEEEDSEDMGRMGASGPRDGSQGEDEVSNTLDEVPMHAGEGARAGHANHINGVVPPHGTHGSHGTHGTQHRGQQPAVDLEQSEGGWTLYRKKEQSSDLPVPVPPPMVSTSDDEMLVRADEPDVLPPAEDAPAAPPQPTAAVNTSRQRPCDKRVDLYVLQPDRLNASGTANPLKGKLTNCHATGCERPFSVQKIPHSNLILLVVDTLCPCGNKKLAIQPQEVVYEGASSTCKGRNPRDNLARRRPPKCISYHPEEVEIHACGSATKQSLSTVASWTFLVLATLRHVGLAWLAS